MNAEEKRLAAKFIKDNNLKFSLGRRNSDSTVLSGYLLHIGVDSLNGLKKIITENCPDAYDFMEEFNRVFEFAETNNYGAFWRTAQAKREYKF